MVHSSWASRCTESDDILQRNIDDRQFVRWYVCEKQEELYLPFGALTNDETIVDCMRLVKEFETRKKKN